MSSATNTTQLTRPMAPYSIDTDSIFVSCLDMKTLEVHKLDDQYSIPVASKHWSELATIEPENAPEKALMVCGKEIQGANLLKLMKNLYLSQLMVNCNGLSFVRIIGATDESLVQYLRMFDIFDWSRFQVESPPPNTTSWTHGPLALKFKNHEASTSTKGVVKSNLTKELEARFAMSSDSKSLHDYFIKFARRPHISHGRPFGVTAYVGSWLSANNLWKEFSSHLVFVPSHSQVPMPNRPFRSSPFMPIQPGRRPTIFDQSNWRSLQGSVYQATYGTIILERSVFTFYDPDSQGQTKAAKEDHNIKIPVQIAQYKEELAYGTEGIPLPTAPYNLPRGQPSVVYCALGIGYRYGYDFLFYKDCT